METIAPIAQLARQLSHFPGIGSKTALRLAYFTLDMPESDVQALADALVYAKANVHPCKICGNYTEQDVCYICSSPLRTSDVLCVVKDARDVTALEKTHDFGGRYHVLGGVISPMDGIGPDDIRINELLERIQTENVKEIVLATNPDIEGEATATYIASLAKPAGVKVTRIAHGIPIGSNLEYVDSVTLSKAFEGRREF